MDEKQQRNPTGTTDATKGALATWIIGATRMRCNESIHMSRAIPTPAEELGMACRMLRRKRGLSVPQLAEKANLSPESLIALEAGLLPVEKVGELLPALAKACGIDPRALCKFLFDSL